MTAALPDPLVPAEVDLRGLKYMPLLGGRLFGSNFDLDANDSEFRVGLRLWWAAWNQVPAGSLPPEDHRIRGLAGLAENPAKWKKVRDRALDGFTLCSDGRLYHPIVAEQALIAWEKRAEDLEERENEADRQRRLRQDRKRMFAELRAAGMTPKWDIGTSELRALHKEHVTQNVTPPVTVTSDAPVTVTSTAKTGRDGTVSKDKEQALADTPPPLRAPADGQGEGKEPTSAAPPPEVNGHEPTHAGRVCRAMRQAGVQQVNPGDPRLLALLGQGATDAEFIGLAEEAVRRGIKSPWPWILQTLQGRRADAAAIRLAPQDASGQDADPLAWTKSRSAVIDRANRLGIGPFDEVAAHVGTGPSWAKYRAEVIAASERQGATT